MKTNINLELFKRYAPIHKLEIIESLSQEELLAITPKTVARMVKEAGEGKKRLTQQTPQNQIEPKTRQQLELNI